MTPRIAFLPLSRTAGEGGERSEPGEGQRLNGGVAPLTPTPSPLRGGREKKGKRG